MVLGSLALMLVVAVLVVVVWRPFQAGKAAAATLTEPVDALALVLDEALQRGPSSLFGLALRPLSNANTPADTALLADGVCATLADRLARLPSLRVVPCSSTAIALAAELSDRRLARLLAVRYVLTGNLEQVRENRVRVRLAMHEAENSREAWRIDEEIDNGDLQSLPARVARATSKALGQEEQIPATPQIDPELYAKYLRASQLARRGSLEERRLALQMVEQILIAAPDHVSSLYLQQNMRGSLLGNMGGPEARESAAAMHAAREAHRESGLALARRMVAGDPLDVRAQTLLMNNEVQTRQWVPAFERLDGMLQRNARDPGMLRLAARVNLHAGYVTRARELALGAAQLNALDVQALEILALTSGIQGRNPQLREYLAVARQIGPDAMRIAESLEAHGRADWPELERIHTAWVGWGGKWPADWVPQFVRGLADPAHQDAAVRMLDGHDDGTRQHFASYYVEYAMLGDYPRALKSIQHHAKLPPAPWTQALWWPLFTPVRVMPGFAPAMQDLGLTQLWAARGAPDFCSQDAAGAWHCR